VCRDPAAEKRDEEARLELVVAVGFVELVERVDDDQAVCHRQSRVLRHAKVVVAGSAEPTESSEGGI